MVYLSLIDELEVETCDGISCVSCRAFAFYRRVFYESQGDEMASCILASDRGDVCLFYLQRKAALPAGIRTLAWRRIGRFMVVETEWRVGR